MNENFTFHDFTLLYPNDEACLEEIKKLQYPNGIYCHGCQKETSHYKIKNRTSYACKSCRNHIYPLTGTVFEKSSTPLRIWFYAIFLMTQTRGNISIKQLQRELHVTYKTAWRIYHVLYDLMEMKNRDLLEDSKEPKKTGIARWSFFYKIEYTEDDD